VLKVLSGYNMAKKNLLGDFEFKKFDNLSNGIEIPVTNSLKANKETVQKNVVPTPVVPTKRVEEKKVLPKERKSPIDLPNFNYKGKEEIKPLINVVPTSSPKKVVPTNIPKVVPTNALKKQAIVDSDINLSEYGALKTKDEKVLYLAMRGWSLKVEQRRNALFHYATKYISRKKKRIYLGSVNSES
jgi:hypothetical protein